MTVQNTSTDFIAIFGRVAYNGNIVVSVQNAWKEA